MGIFSFIPWKVLAQAVPLAIEVALRTRKHPPPPEGGLETLKNEVRLLALNYGALARTLKLLSIAVVVLFVLVGAALVLGIVLLLRG